MGGEGQRGGLGKGWCLEQGRKETFFGEKVGLAWHLNKLRSQKEARITRVHSGLGECEREGGRSIKIGRSRKGFSSSKASRAYRLGS